MTPKHGIVLILVAVVIVMVGLAGLSFVMTMSTENKAIHVHGDELQLNAAVASGEELLRVYSEQPAEVQAAAGGCWDNPQLFRGVQVFDDARTGRRGCVSLASPKIENDEITGLRFGAENESARLNLAMLPLWEQQNPAAGMRALTSLPGMTEQIAAAILDWIDADDQPRPNGAEADYYKALYVPYAPRNAPPATLEELLLVRGVTRDLLLGKDLNANFQLDARETGGAALHQGDSAAGAPLSWASLLTVYSAERNVTEQGQPRIDLNDPDLARLYQRLAAVFDPRWAEFIVLYRQYGPASSGQWAVGSGQGTGGQTGTAAVGAVAPPVAPARRRGGMIVPPQPTTSPTIAVPLSPTPASGPQPTSPSSTAPQRTPSSPGVSQLTPLTPMVPQAAPGGGPTSPQSSFSIAPSPSVGPGAAPATGPQGSFQQVPGGAGQSTPDFSVAGSFRLASPLDLIGVWVSVPKPAGQPPQFVESPFWNDRTAMRSYLPVLMDQTTTVPDKAIRGRVNVNLAPRAVLRGVPGLEGTLVEQIVASRRAVADDPSRRQATWLLSEGLVDLPQMKALLPFLTAGGDVYRAQIVGYFDDGNSAARAEVVIDATASPPRQLYWKDLRLLGAGYSRETISGVRAR